MAYIKRTITKDERLIISKVMSFINEQTASFTDLEYRRLLKRLIKRAYAVKNIDHHKKPSPTDFNSIDNPKRKKRFNQTCDHRSTK